MSAVSQYSDATRSAKAAAIVALIAGGFVRLWNGAMPVDGNAAPAGVQLAEFDIAPDIDEVDGVITMDLAGEAAVEGTASVGTVHKADGTRVANFNVGATDTSGFVLEFDNPTLTVGAEIEATLTWTEAATGA